MRTPHPEGNNFYQDSLPYRTVPYEEEQLISGGYKFLGWVNNWTGANPPEYSNCINEAHNYYTAFPNVWKTVQHTPSGSDVTKWCTKCKIYWKVDMS